MRRGIWQSLKKKNNGKIKNSRKWEVLAGYTINELCNHLEKQFTPEMSWDNWGDYWHIDHILPISKFNFEKPEDDDFKKCWSLKNLQPLRADINIRKQDKIERPMQTSLIFN